MEGSDRVRRVFVLVVSLIIVSCHVYATEVRLTAGGIHLPIIRRPLASGENQRRRRSVSTGSIGLGDYEDITYNVLIQVGGTHIPVVLDTGSSDLWVLSASCQSGTSSSSSSCPAVNDRVPLYSLSNFIPAQLDAKLTYGDSNTGTYAQGPIGSDSVSIAGLALSSQYFAAINATNTSVVQTGSAGIFGLGFPFSSLVWMDLLRNQTQRPQNDSNELDSESRVGPRPHPEDAPVAVPARFPESLKSLGVVEVDHDSDEAPLTRSTQEAPLITTSVLQSSVASYGPFIPRLVAQGMLDSPMFSIALQRDAIQIGGNEGMLSIGQLPPTVGSESLTWVSVRLYPPSQGGLNAPSDASGEVYPIMWEIPVDDVWFDGVKLAKSKLSSPYISLSALIDTGNSLIRGPPDVVAQIENMLGGSRFDCAVPHSLTFQIGGKFFPVDPRDFISEVRAGNPDECSANVAPTDVPAWGGHGYLYSWNLGDPFLKSVLAAFHYGSLTHPSQNPPRVGLLSTVEVEADKELSDDERQAKLNHQGYSILVEPAPASLSPAKDTGIGGVPLAPVPTATQNASWGTSTSDASGMTGVSLVTLTVGLAWQVVWLAWRVIW